MRASAGLYFTRVDHLRFLAVLLVLWWHFKPYYVALAAIDSMPLNPFLSLFNEGHTGVSLFFTLSGFIFAALNFDKEIVYKQFIKNRILRIAPLAFVWFFYSFVTTNISPADLVAAAALGLNRGALPGVGWSLVVEWQFYLLFPFLLLFSRFYGIKFLLGLIAVAFLIRNLAYIQLGSAQGVAFAYMFGRIDQFVFGMLAGYIFAKHYRLLAKYAYLIFIGGAIFTSLTVYHLESCGGFLKCSSGARPFTSSDYLWTYFCTLEGFGYASIILGYLAIPTIIPSWIDKRVAELGTISYSIYWCHVQVMDVILKHPAIAELAGSPWRALLIFIALILPAVILVSTLSYLVIERPFLDLRRNYTQPKAPIVPQFQPQTTNSYGP